MLTPAHIASSYLLSQVPALFGQPLTTSEILAVIVAGNILDADFIFGRWFGKNGGNHHTFPTHTPMFALVLWLLSVIFWMARFNWLMWALILISLLLHLFLDTIGQWFCLWGWQEISREAQINWLYPFKRFTPPQSPKTDKDLFLEYISQAKANLNFEAAVILLAAVVLFW